jgi:uncharacterized membrane protein YfcA
MDYIANPYSVLVLVTLATSVVTLFTGFGVGTVLAPVMALYFDVKVAVFLAAIVHFFNNASRLYLYRDEVHWGVIKRFGIISLLGAFLGSYAQIFIDSAWLKSGFGLFLAIYGLAQFIPGGAGFKIPKRLDPVGGFLSGLLGGLIGNQGAIRSLYLLNYELEKKEFIASAALIAIVIDATRIPVYIYTMHQYLFANLGLMAAIVAASILGTMLASRVLPQVSAELFKRIILAAVILIGTLMLLGKV